VYDKPVANSVRCYCDVGFAGNYCQKPVADGDWIQKGQDELKATLKVSLNQNKAKNVIFFIGDGMSMPTITAARIYKTQQENANAPGEEGELSWEDFPATGLLKTYNVNTQTTDSAAAATAMLTGQKANYGTMGCNKKVVRYDCQALAEGGEAESIVSWAQAEGKRTGVVTTTRVTHATPSSAYAHVAARDWEVDAFGDNTGNSVDYTDIVKKYGCSDAASQYVNNEPGNKLNVLMGGGRRNFIGKNTSDPGAPGEMGVRNDNVNLIQKWLDLREERNEEDRSSFLYNLTQFKALDTAKTDFVFGAFSRSHFDFYDQQPMDDTRSPYLWEMTEAAIKILDKGDKGFFLLVEGGRIDQAHHAGQARRALEETVEFHKAIEKAKSMTSEEDTLIVVTSDHSHEFFMGGYSGRGNDILGLVDTIDTEPALDGFHRTTLGYGDGPGPARGAIDENEIRKPEYEQQRLVHTADESHGGDDVPVYARGPMAHLFSGVHEQNYVAHAMAYASCIGANKDHCKTSNTSPPKPNDCNSGERLVTSGLVTLMVSLRMLLF
jgi:alkaline phosphatase